MHLPIAQGTKKWHYSNRLRTLTCGHFGTYGESHDLFKWLISMIMLLLSWDLIDIRGVRVSRGSTVILLN